MFTKTITIRILVGVDFYPGINHNTKQHNNTTFRYSSFILWSVFKPLLFDTTVHEYKYKTKWQTQMKWRHRKMIFLLFHQSNFVPEKQRFAHRP